MSVLTIEQKARKRRLDNLSSHLNRIRVEVATKRITSWPQIINQLGIEKDNDFSKYIYDQTIPTVGKFNELIAWPLENQLRSKLADEASGKIVPVSDKPAADEEVYDASVHGPHPLDNTNWLPPSSAAQKCTLFPHQVKAAKDLAYQLFIKNHRTALLRAGVGVGKTYMFGQFVRWLWDKNWFQEVMCLSAWPVLIVTKASIVEQTRRVMVNQFGLDPHRQVTVINYDALRATFGSSTMIESTFEVEGGIRYRKFKWRPFIHPKLFILDEAQSAKNEDSQQSMIIQSIAAIDDPLVKVVCSSATPWTRISEAKYFCINTHMNYRLV